ncbi:hypothetical protein ABEB36_000646 [Hypothenemus hampei]|uniref:Odorant receptor n=1 Tax=Hypothenemus hampei TaxID=57062 RepID=A0ABD1FDV5_HYPHA
MEVYFYFSASNRVHFNQYLPFYLNYSFILNTSLLQLKTTEIFVTISGNFKDVFRLNIDNMEQEFKKIINSLSFKVESFVLYLGICDSVIIILHLYVVLFYEDRLMLQLFFNKDSILYQMARIAVCCFFMNVVFITVACPTHLIYGLFHAQIQILRLLDKIKKFGNRLSIEEVDDECILENLKIFGQNHLDIKRYHYEAFEVNHWYSTLYSITGLMVGVSSLIEMFFYNAPKGPALFIFFGYISILYVITAVVQEYEDELKHLSYALYDLKWHLWDVKCQKFHLLLMGQVAQELKISILFVLHADFQLFKKFLRVTYTVANCLITFWQKNH